MFNPKSLRILDELHIDLKTILLEAAKSCHVQFQLSEGYRSPERQKQLFDKKLSIKDGTNSLSKHNLNPSMAVDIHIHSPGFNLTFDWIHLSYVAGHLQALSHTLFTNNIIHHKLRWGGNWDSDGIIIHDQKLQDGVHFELV